MLLCPDSLGRGFVGYFKFAVPVLQRKDSPSDSDR